MKKGLATIANKPLYKIRRLQLLNYIAFLGLIIEGIFIVFLLMN